MTRWLSLIAKMRQNQASIQFTELCALLKKLGFNQRSGKGSHVAIFRRPDLPDVFLNLQPIGVNAKAYQVRQVLKMIDNHGLEKELEV